MVTRSALLAFLLLTACMAGDGTLSIGQDVGGPVLAPVLAAVEAPVVLPEVPRMRPNPSRRTQPARSVAPLGGTANSGGTQHTGTVAEARRSAGGAEGGQNAGTTAAETTRVAGAMTSGGSSAVTRGYRDVNSGAVPAVDPAPRLVETRPRPAPPPDGPVEASGTVAAPLWSADAAESPPADRVNADDRADETRGTEIDVAAQPLPKPHRGIDVESLFDGDVVRYCAAMWQMGEYIGAARRRGASLKRAIGESVRRIAVEEQLPLDNRLAFSGQVYGRLVYRLEQVHAALTFGTYVHFACLTVRGDQKIVPADPDAERLLNSGLTFCESTAFTREDLNDCIFRELTPVVERRNS